MKYMRCMDSIMYVFTLLITVALAAVMNASAADSKSFGSYGDGSSKRRDSDYHHDDSHYHDHDHYHEHDHDHSSHGSDFEPPKTLVTRSLLPEEDVAQVPDMVQPELPTVLNPIGEGAAALAEDVTSSPLGDDPVSEGAALAGITENSSPINPPSYVYQINPYQGYPPPPPPQYMTSQPHYPPPPPSYERYPYAPRYHQYPPPPPPPNPYGRPPPNPYGPRYIPA